MKKLLTGIFEFGALISILLLVFLLAGVFFWKLPTYEQLTSTEGKILHIHIREDDIVEEIGWTKERYYLILGTETGMRELRSEIAYIQHILPQIQSAEQVSIKTYKNEKQVWEIEDAETVLVSYQEIYAQAKQSRQRQLFWLKLASSISFLITVGSACWLKFGYKLPLIQLLFLPFRDASSIREEAEDQAAQNILEDIQRNYFGLKEYRRVKAEDFSHLNLKFYDEAMQLLQKRRFSHLADEEILLDGKGDLGTFLRVALSSDGTIMAALYHFKPKLWNRILLRLSGQKFGETYEFETEFSDGSFLTTCNGELAANMETPPIVFAEYCPYDTSLDDVLKRHRLRISAYQEEVPGIRPVVMKDLEDLHQSQQRLDRLKTEHRKRLGGVSKQELERLSHGNAELAERIRRKIHSIHPPSQESGHGKGSVASSKEQTFLKDPKKEALRLFHKQLLQEDRVTYTSLVFATLLVSFPALSTTGFGFDFLADLSLPILVSLSVLGSLLFFCLGYPNRRYWYMGIVPGLFSGPLIFWATVFYTYWRKSILNYEAVIPMILGAVPGLILWYFPLRWIVVRDLIRELSQAHAKVSSSAAETTPAPSSFSSQKPDTENLPEKQNESERFYRVVFRGEIISGFVRDEVKKQIALLYKVPPERSESLFSGRQRSIKENVDYQTALKYQKAFKRRGALCYIEELPQGIQSHKTA